MDIMTLFWRGIWIGLVIAIPVGPIGVLCIRRSLAYGRAAGFVSGLGAATADALYGSIAGFGLAMLSNYLIEQANWIRLIGGLFIIYLGLRTIQKAPATQEAVIKGSSLVWMFATSLFLTLTNPMTILSFAAVFAGLGVVNQNDIQGAAWLVLGVFGGSALWWLVLSSIAAFMRERLQFKHLVWINRLAGFVILIFGLYALLGSREQAGGLTSALVVQEGEQRDFVSPEGYERADGIAPIIFPRDHGAHPGFQTEWWYYTGNLWTAEGDRFGYQLTFFRRALIPPALWQERLSNWATDQVYMVHFSVTNGMEDRHDAFEQLARGSGWLAGVHSEPFSVWLDHYKVEEIAPGVYGLQASAISDDGLVLSLNLELQDTQGPTLQGVQGYSQKGPEPGNASYYYSLARLSTDGTIAIGERKFSVDGFSWMDHEYSTSALAADQIGWDWFSIQLDNGSELMFFQLRKADGSVDPYSSGTLVMPDGKQVRLAQGDFTIDVLDTWQSPESGAVYPARWRVHLPSSGISLTVTPVIADQELNVSYAYWEGAVDIEGEFSGEAVAGVGYVELTGYAGSMAGEF